MTAGTLVVRADAGSDIGAGHVMRCLALAEEWRERGGAVVLVSTGLPDRLADRWRRCGCTLVEQGHEPGTDGDADHLAALSSETGASWVVIDGYSFGVGFQRRLRAAGCGVMAVDDNGEAGDYDCDLVLNQNPHACEGLYRRRADRCGLLLGLDYCLLRREFTLQRPEPSFSPRAHRVLVLAGGGDDDGLLSDIVSWLGAVSEGGLEVHAIAGPLRTSALALAPPPAVGLKLIGGTDEVALEMAHADAAVTAAGTTCWELAYMGIPAAAVAVVENQRAVAAWLDKTGALLALDRESLAGRVSGDALRLPTGRRLGALLFDGTIRARLAQRAGRLVDGQGARRVVDALLEGGG